MSVIAVVGAQWGDEGKGRVVDYLAADADLVIRYGGGNNAGHTVVNPHGHFKLHLIPSGIFHPARATCWATGWSSIRRRCWRSWIAWRPPGSTASNLFISDRAHLVMPYHVLLDQLEERERGRREARDDLARHRSGLRGQGRTAGIRVVDLHRARCLSRAARHGGLARVRRLIDGYYRAGGPEDELRQPSMTLPTRIASPTSTSRPGTRLRLSRC